MTRTKVTKTIAIVLAMCLAFAVMSVTMTMNAKADAVKFDKETYSISFEDIGMSRNADNDNYYVAARDSYENTPDFTIKITFPNANGTFLDKNVAEYVKLYSDSELKNEITIPSEYFIDDQANTASEVSFTLRLHMLTTLQNNKTYYLALAPELTANGDLVGDDITIQFAIPGTSTTSSTTKSTTRSTTTTTRRTYTTTRTTYRTVRTVSSTVRAKSANTGDESNMPLWIAVAILAAGAGSIAFVWKAKE